ncbi:MAG: hypothetical protein PHG75_05560 [Syntrophomonas sp.]|nr:hypothetical protein [Syntrophomonas sp.]
MGGLLVLLLADWQPPSQTKVNINNTNTLSFLMTFTSHPNHGLVLSAFESACFNQAADQEPLLESLGSKA